MNQDNEARWREEFEKDECSGCDVSKFESGIYKGQWNELKWRSYLAAKRASQKELKHWTDVHGSILAGMDRDKKTIVKNMSAEIKELRDLVIEAKQLSAAFKITGETVHVKRKLKEWDKKARDVK